MNSHEVDNGFGNYIRELRTNKKIGQRELARKIGVSSSYLNDIEKGKRGAPRVELVNKLVNSLEADVGTINDFAGLSNNTVPPDISEYIRGNSELISLLRMIKGYNLDASKLTRLKKL